MADENAIHRQRLEETIILMRQDVQRRYPYVASLFEIVCFPYNAQIRTIKYSFAGKLICASDDYYEYFGSLGIDKILNEFYLHIIKRLEYVASMIINYGNECKQLLPSHDNRDETYFLTSMWFNLSLSNCLVGRYIHFNNYSLYFTEESFCKIEEFLADCYSRNDAYWRVLRALPMPIADEVKYFL